MEVLRSEHIKGPGYHVDIALLRFPLGEYRVIENYHPHGPNRRTSGYLSTRGFFDNADKGSLLHYLRRVGYWINHAEEAQA